MDHLAIVLRPVTVLVVVFNSFHFRNFVLFVSIRLCHDKHSVQTQSHLSSEKSSHKVSNTDSLWLTAIISFEKNLISAVFYVRRWNWTIMTSSGHWRLVRSVVCKVNPDAYFSLQKFENSTLQPTSPEGWRSIRWWRSDWHRSGCWLPNQTLPRVASKTHFLFEPSAGKTSGRACSWFHCGSTVVLLLLLHIVFPNDITAQSQALCTWLRNS